MRFGGKGVRHLSYDNLVFFAPTPLRTPSSTGPMLATICYRGRFRYDFERMPR
jgi:hypothetical protein